MVDPDSAELPLSASAETDDETADDTETEVDLAVEYDDKGEAFDDAALINTSTSTTPRGYRSPKNRR